MTLYGAFVIGVWLYWVHVWNRLNGIVEGYGELDGVVSIIVYDI